MSKREIVDSKATKGNAVSKCTNRLPADKSRTCSERAQIHVWKFYHEKTDCGAAKRDAVRANPAPRQEKTDLLKKSKRRRNRHLEHIRHWQFPKENVFLQDKQNKHRWTAKPSEDRRNAANLAGPRFQNSVRALSNGTNKTSK